MTRTHPAPLQEGKLAASEELGDLFKGASDWDTAQAIYQQAGASGKVVEALAAKGDFDQLVRRRGWKAGVAHSQGAWLMLVCTWQTVIGESEVWLPST